MQALRQIVKLFTDSILAWNRDGAARLAAALAFYTLLSLSPLLIVIVGVTGAFVGQESIRNEIVTQVRSAVSDNAAELVNSIIENNTQPGTTLGATLIGVGLLIFGASGIFTQLYESMNTLWHIAPYPDRSGIIVFLLKRLIAIVMVAAIGLILIASLVASAMLAVLARQIESALPGGPSLGGVLNFLLSTGILTLTFALLFKYVPAAKVRWRDVLPGSLLTAILFVIGESVLSLYLSRSNVPSIYGAAGSVVVLLIWIYYSAQILFFGAEFTAVYAERYGDGIQPADNATRASDD